MAVSVGSGLGGNVAPPRELFALAGHPGTWGSAAMTTGFRYDVDARGERFLVSLGLEGPPPIVVVVGGAPAAKD